MLVKTENLDVPNLMDFTEKSYFPGVFFYPESAIKANPVFLPNLNSI